MMPGTRKVDKEIYQTSLWLTLGALVAFMDLFTGPYIQFPFFFLVPVALASWYNGRRLGIILAIALPLIRPVYFLGFWQVNYNSSYVLINAIIKILVFAIFAELIHRIATAARFRSQILRSLPIGIWVTDRNGKLVQSNPAVMAIWGKYHFKGPIQESGIRMGWHDTGHGIDNHDWALVRALRDGETTLDEILDLERPDGQRRVVLNSAVPLRDDKGGITGALLINQDITEAKRLEKERQDLARSLEEARRNLKVLGGLLPICASCKKIRDNRGSWSQMEDYISSHSEAEFSHGICPDCLHRHYPEYAV